VRKAIMCLVMLAVMLVMPVSVAMAAPTDFGGNGEFSAWSNDYGQHYVNNNNPDLRMDWTNQRFAVPGQGGANANENAAIIPWGDGSLVVPLDTM